MSPRKLSESDKKDILSLYRLPEETTSTLAGRYGVSNSTISRLLKSNLSEPDYEVLIQQKRSGRTQNSSSQAVTEAIKPPENESASQEEVQEVPVREVPILDSSQRRRRKRPSTPIPAARESALSESLSQETSAQHDRLEEAEPLPPERPIIPPPENHAVSPSPKVLEMLGEELEDLDEDDDELEDLDEDDDWDEDDDLADTESQYARVTLPQKRNSLVQVLPISQASFPKTCYLVVDKAAELIARPLKDFSDLGTIPAEEVQEKTLPVFDNHRVARRFSNRSQRVIKVPDGQMLQKTSSHLHAKGITRLLMDGQVYSLLPMRQENLQN
ncbi:MAG: hypothetical protein KME06_11870 [Kastovskya adunca ATA6-11-RM4]|jgi:transcriptional regulator with XRE-family HTH domain|nr:hypothetical protein [Kastovskya adunca ATA6-11-RM4]